MKPTPAHATKYVLKNVQNRLVFLFLCYILYCVFLNFYSSVNQHARISVSHPWKMDLRCVNSSSTNVSIAVIPLLYFRPLSLHLPFLLLSHLLFHHPPLLVLPPAALSAQSRDSHARLSSALSSATAISSAPLRRKRLALRGAKITSRYVFL